MTVLIWISAVIGIWLVGCLLVVGGWVLAAMIAAHLHRCGDRGRVVDLMSLYAPEQPQMVPMYGDSGELVGWRLP